MDTATKRSTLRPRNPADAPVRVTAWRRNAEAGRSGLSMGRIRAALNDAIHADLPADIERVRNLSRWMDTKFSFAGVRFGLDGLIGLIPGVGDTVTALISLYPLAIARRHQLGRWVQAKIVGNIALDWLVGLVPLVGDLFDVGFKANVRNLRVIERAAAWRGVMPQVINRASATDHPNVRRR